MSHRGNSRTRLSRHAAQFAGFGARIVPLAPGSKIPKPKQWTDPEEWPYAGPETARRWFS
jgi:hypothetical protein